MKEIFKNLQEAEKTLYFAGNLVNVTFPLYGDKRILLKFLSEIKMVFLNCINFILQYEYISKRICLSQNSKINLNIFNNQCALRYGITPEERKIIYRIFELEEKHRQSSMEFRRGNWVVILSKDSKPEIFTLHEAREFLQTGKNILGKILNTLQRGIKKG